MRPLFHAHQVSEGADLVLLGAAAPSRGASHADHPGEPHCRLPSDQSLLVGAGTVVSVEQHTEAGHVSLICLSAAVRTVSLKRA